MKITAWIAHKSLPRTIFISRNGSGIVFGFLGFTVHIGLGPWGVEWQGSDTKRFGDQP